MKWVWRLSDDSERRVETELILVQMVFPVLVEIA
jgi:hypothetical protein